MDMQLGRQDGHGVVAQFAPRAMIFAAQPLVGVSTLLPNALLTQYIRVCPILIGSAA